MPRSIDSQCYVPCMQHSCFKLSRAAPSSPAAAGQQQTSIPQGGGTASSDWLRGLLAEADVDPFAASQATQQPAARGRPALAERQPSAAVVPQQAPPFLPPAKRQCSAATASLLFASLHPAQQPQQQQSPPCGAGGAFGDGVDDLDLGDE